MYLGPHKFRTCQPFPENARHEGEEEILDDRHSHTEHKEIEDLVEPFGELRVLFFK